MDSHQPQDKTMTIDLSKLPPLTPEIINMLGIAVEAGCDEETQREAFGNDTVDWLNAAHELPEMVEFNKKRMEEIAPIIADREAERQAKHDKWVEERRQLEETTGGPFFELPGSDPPDLKWRLARTMFSAFHFHNGSLEDDCTLGIAFTPPQESIAELNRIFGSKNPAWRNRNAQLGIVKLDTDGKTLTKVTILDEKLD